MRLVFRNEKETFDFGVKLSKALAGGEVILLLGEMGAGKTALTKGIASGLSIDREISSPTFTLLNIYNGRLDLFHYDLFRLESIEEAEESGLFEYFGRKSGVAVIEWADKLPLDFSNMKVIKISMQYIDENQRAATVDGL